jgi:uncharacterized protein (DUF58 family)
MLLERPEEILVYPQVDPEAVHLLPDADVHEGDTPRHALGAGHEVAGLREYATGDSHRRIHWRASLRRGELLVRDTESERNARVDVRLARASQDFERAVRRAASEVVAFLDAGMRVGLRDGSEQIEAGAGRRHRASLLSYLATVEREA